MSNELQRRLLEALDNEQVSDELLAEVSAHPELEAFIEQDAGLRSMPRVDFDLSESVLGRLDEELDDIPGLFDAPEFESDLAPPSTLNAPVSNTATSNAPVSNASSKTAAPVSLDDERRKRSAAPFLLSAAAVIGLVATATLSTLNSPEADQVAMESSGPRAAAPTASAAMPEEAPTQAMARGALAAAEPEMAEEAEEADWEPESDLDPAAGSNADSSTVTPAAAAPEAMELALADELAPADGQDQPRARSAPARLAAMSSARGGALGSADEDSLADNLTASQRRTVARIESCLPDHIRITRVRESANGEHVAGVETSEPLSDEVDACVSGVLDTFPRARRRRRSVSMRATPPSPAAEPAAEDQH